jgi:LysR family hydrogen peroxide-inducible transcriptional activator
MTLTQLNYILAVQRCRNFAQAARECHVTQPTLSMQIQKLEEYLQLIIFDRSKNPIEPTAVGKKILETAHKILSGSHELEELSKTLRGEVSGEFYLSVIPTLAPYVLPLFIGQFVKLYPQVDLKIYETQTSEIVRQLREGKIDGAIMAVPLETSEFKENHLFYEPFRIFFSPEHPLLKKKLVLDSDLNPDEAWLLKEGHCLRTQALQVCQFKKTQKNRNLFFEAGSLETLINMVKTTQGFTILPELACGQLSPQDQKLLRDFKSHLPVRDVSFVTGPFALKTSIEKVLIKMMRDNIPKHLQKNSSRMEVLPIN